MESLDGVKEIDPWGDARHPVALKGGINISQLAYGGVNMEIDVDALGAVDEKVNPTASFDQSEILKQLNFDCMDFGGDDSSTSESDDQLSPFERLAKEMKPVPGTGSDVLKKIIRGGVGPVVPEGATVRVHYNGYLEYSDEPYDSSRLRNHQQQFRLGQGTVILGWDMGVATMKKSELSRFLVKSNYAFGDIGCPPRIPPGATIMFEIEVINFIDHKAADDFDGLTKEEKKEATLDQLIAVANAEREAGNDSFEQRNFGRASSKYLRAIRLLEPVHLKDEQEEKKWKEVLLKLYLNISLCSLKMTRSKLAITQCRKALDLQPNNVKGNFRLGQAFMQLGEFKKSKGCLMKAGRLSPGNQEIRLELLKLDKAVTKFKALEKSMCARMVQFSAPKDLKKSAKNDAMDKMREDFKRELTMMKDKHSMRQIVLPQFLSAEQVGCAEEVAHELGLKTEKSSGSGLRIYKEDILIQVDSADH